MEEDEVVEAIIAPKIKSGIKTKEDGAVLIKTDLIQIISVLSILEVVVEIVGVVEEGMTSQMLSVMLVINLVIMRMSAGVNRMTKRLIVCKKMMIKIMPF